MGLTYQSSGLAALRNEFLSAGATGDYVVALAGNPNTGKSTVFNALTGLKQHTGNWPGKTVAQAQGNYEHKGKVVTLVDLPGTYSLLANSAEEEIARDFICFAKPDATVVVVDATCLERNLNLVLQVMEITSDTVVCLNLMDEAQRKGIKVNLQQLESELGVPVVPTAARNGEGLPQLKDTINALASGQISPHPVPLAYPLEIEQMVEEVENCLPPEVRSRFNPRWVALRLIDGDYKLVEQIEKHLSGNALGGIAQCLQQAEP